MLVIAKCPTVAWINGEPVNTKHKTKVRFRLGHKLNFKMK